MGKGINNYGKNSNETKKNKNETCFNTKTSNFAIKFKTLPTYEKIVYIDGYYMYGNDCYCPGLYTEAGARGERPH